MKNLRQSIILILVFAFSWGSLVAQDLIIKQNGDEIEAVVVEISTDAIKYRPYDFQDGPLRSLKVSEVFMIIYANGIREKFGTAEQPGADDVSEVQKVQEALEAQDEQEDQQEAPKSKYKGNYFMLANGYGNSYGGLGLRIQFRAGDIVGFGMHAGVGYFPDAPVLVSGGVKFFPYKFLYINTQFGLTGWEKTRYWDSWGTVETSGHLLYGPSLMFGGDFNWGGSVGFGFNAAVGVSYYINAEYMDNFAPAFDLGFVVRF